MSQVGHSASRSGGAFWALRVWVLTAMLLCAVCASADVRFKGKLVYRDISGLTLPIRYASVVANDENFGALHSFQNNSYTDSLGNFDFTIPTRSDTGPLDSGLIDPYLLVRGWSNPDLDFKLIVYGKGEVLGYPYTNGYRFSSTYFDAVGTLASIILTCKFFGTGVESILAHGRIRRQV